MTIKFAFAAAALAVALTASGVAFAPAAFAQNSQQTRMTQCNTQATGKKGDDRKAFMKSCLSNPQPAALKPQDRMKVCNTQATGKKGDDRKAFMKSCLSNK